VDCLAAYSLHEVAPEDAAEGHGQGGHRGYPRGGLLVDLHRCGVELGEQDGGVAFGHAQADGDQDGAEGHEGLKDLHRQTKMRKKKKKKEKKVHRCSSRKRTKQTIVTKKEIVWKKALL
jgi:hypothetical protein